MSFRLIDKATGTDYAASTSKPVVNRWHPRDRTCEHDGCYDEMFCNPVVGHRNLFGLQIPINRRMCVKHYAEYSADKALSKLKEKGTC